MTKVQVSIPSDLYENAACCCMRQGCTLDDLVAKALEDRLYIERGLERLWADIQRSIPSGESC